VTNHAYEVQLFKATLILTQTNFKTKELYKFVETLFGHDKQQDFMHILWLQEQVGVTNHA
jgi:hypothetical protein